MNCRQKLKQLKKENKKMFDVINKNRYPHNGLVIETPLKTRKLVVTYRLGVYDAIRYRENANIRECVQKEILTKLSNEIRRIVKFEEFGDTIEASLFICVPDDKW